MEIDMEKTRKEQLEAFHEIGRNSMNQGDDGDFLRRTCATYDGFKSRPKTVDILGLYQ
jgi:hypothetical protein